MHHDTRVRIDETRTFTLDKLLTSAVEYLMAEGQNTEARHWAEGYVAHFAFGGDRERARTSIADVREEMEKDAADNLESAERAHNAAAQRLTHASQRLERFACNSTE